jgi:asparagine synthase (glutamine-hydrolysing)
MCAIAGLIDCGDLETLTRMTDIQTHRGPDDSGLWEHRGQNGTWVGLGSRRLSILDLSPAGHMPMGTEDGKLWIVYNGEIYNSPELRRALQTQGERFKSSGDTEVILRLYAREGPACLARLNGIFSIAICDLRSGRPELFLARDPFGVKPFYYGLPGEGLIFASELKAVLEHQEISRELGPGALDRYLTFLWVPEPDTIFKNVHKLPAGHCALYKNGAFNLQRYWDLTFPSADHEFRIPEKALVEETRERFYAAIKSQMLSDVPVGAFLSSGIDSASILAAMASNTNDRVCTYTITFPERYRCGESNLDDPKVAARTAAHFGARHKEIVVDPDVVGLLPKLIWHMDEPVADPAIIMAYSVCHEASKEVMVLLSGIGGDEIFGGYRKYQASLLAQKYRMLPSSLREGFLDPAMRSIPTLNHTRFKTYVGWARKWGRSASLGPQEQFIRDATYLDQMDRTGLSCFPDGGDVNFRHHEAFARVAHADWLNKMLYVDSKLFMPSLNLNYNDKMSMAVSLEVRVPFLDREFVEWVAWNVPPSLKIKRGMTKHILRQAMKFTLPKGVLRQFKKSFCAPIGYWLTQNLKEMTDDLLSARRIKERGWFKPAAVQRMIVEHRSGQKDWAMQIWQLLTAELWAQQFLDFRIKAGPNKVAVSGPGRL